MCNCMLIVLSGQCNMHIIVWPCEMHERLFNHRMLVNPIHWKFFFAQIYKFCVLFNCTYRAGQQNVRPTTTSTQCNYSILVGKCNGESRAFVCSCLLCLQSKLHSRLVLVHGAHPNEEGISYFYIKFALHLHRAQRHCARCIRFYLYLLRCCWFFSSSFVAMCASNVNASK